MNDIIMRKRKREREIAVTNVNDPLGTVLREMGNKHVAL
jgi:hypothetical protein